LQATTTERLCNDRQVMRERCSAAFKERCSATLKQGCSTVCVAEQHHPQDLLHLSGIPYNVPQLLTVNCWHGLPPAVPACAAASATQYLIAIAHQAEPSRARPHLTVCLECMRRAAACPTTAWTCQRASLRPQGRRRQREWECWGPQTAQQSYWSSRWHWSLPCAR
jgi:hypothetical protein